MEKNYFIFLKKTFKKILLNFLRAITKKEYDLFISIGDGCVTSQALRDLGLQVYSYPFDWLGVSRASLDDLLILLENKFDSIFDGLIEEYRYEDKIAYGNAIGMVFNHDFYDKTSLEQQLPKVKEKYNRRIKRLFEHIKNSKSVCFVYVQALVSGRSNYRRFEKKDVVKWANRLQQLFPNKKIKLIYIGHNPDLKRDDILIRKISDCLEFSEINNHYIHEHYAWKKNYNMILKVLSRYRLNKR